MRLNKKVQLIFIFLISCFLSYSQNVSINIDNLPPDNSAILDIQSITKGLLIPRMTTTERDLITGASQSLLIYNTITNCFEFWESGKWHELGCAVIGSWECGDILEDPRDGQKYTTVKIGSQCWMSQNLNYGTYVTGISGQAGGDKKYCYNDNVANCDIYGGLYEWPDLMNGEAGCNGSVPPPDSNARCSTPIQGLCSPGWHVPSFFEWILLFKNSGSCPTCFDYNYNIGELGVDELDNLVVGGSKGFNALLGGRASGGGSFSFMGNVGCFWSTDSYMDGGPISQYARSPYLAPSWYPGKIYLTGSSAGDGAFAYSARCVKD